jgi:hypoxanthine phosphoribosyltransferase
MSEEDKLYISYNHIHQLCKEIAPKILSLDIDFIIAIGGGGFIPARILRTFLKQPGEPSKRIFAIILSLYEDLNTKGDNAEEVGTEVKRVQWLDYKSSGVDLVGKKILVIDEVDDSRTTIHYAIGELEKDAAEQAKERGVDNDTEFFVFVLHNKLKPKRAELPECVKKDGHYIAARETGDVWIAYPWETDDIIHHQLMAEKQGYDIDIDRSVNDNSI